MTFEAPILKMDILFAGHLDNGITIQMHAICNLCFSRLYLMLLVIYFMNTFHGNCDDWTLKLVILYYTVTVLFTTKWNWCVQWNHIYLVYFLVFKAKEPSKHAHINEMKRLFCCLVIYFIYFVHSSSVLYSLEKWNAIISWKTKNVHKELKYMNCNYYFSL